MLEFLLFSIVIVFLFIFIGLGFSFLCCPVRFEKYSLFFAPFIGISYLSFSGWLLANYDIGGVENYWPYLLIPPIIFLLLSICWKIQRIFEIFWPFRRENLLLPVICLIIYLCISCPFLIRFDYLTTISLGNNDIALYATVAKLLMHSSISHLNPSLDPTIQLYAGNIDALFASSLTVAYPSSVFGIEPYQIINIIMNLFFIFDVALIFIISYELFNYSKTFSLILAFLTGFSFHLIYIVYQGFYAQVLGMGLFLALYLVIYYPILFDNHTARSYLQYLPFAIILSLGLMFIYYTLVPLFIIPLLIFLGICILTEKTIVHLKKELFYLLLVLFFSVIFYPNSIIKFFEKFLWVNSAAAGWDFPILSPHWVFGIVGNNIWMAKTSLIPTFILSVIIVIMCLSSMKSLYNDNKKLFFFSVSNLLFVLIFYIFLISKEEMSPSFTGEGYKAYKLITYFLPIILISCLYYFKNFELNFSKKDTRKKIVVLGLLGLLLVGNIFSAFTMISINNDLTSFISKDIIDLKIVDNLDNVTSINIQDATVWNQMWINYFLFDKHKVYLKYSSYYEASPQIGEWTLKEKDILSVSNFSNSSGSLLINHNYFLEKSGSCDISLYKGWYSLESNQYTLWRWSGEKNETPSIEIGCNNEEQSINAKLNFSPLNPENNLSILMDGKKITTCSINYCEINNINLTKGKHILSFDAKLPPQLPGNGDTRYLGYAFSKIVISKNV